MSELATLTDDAQRKLEAATGLPAIPISASTHLVFRCGGQIVKVPRPGSLAQQQVLHELAMWRAVHGLMVSQVELADGRVGAVLPELGEPPARWDAQWGPALAAAVHALHSRAVTSMPTLATHHLAAMSEKAWTRLEHVDDMQLRGDVQRLVDELLTGLVDRPDVPVVVSHGDLNLTNFVVDPTGAVHLIDLERVRLAPREWDYATLAMTCVFDTSTPLWETLRAHAGPLHAETFDWCLRQQVAGSLAWAAWQQSQGNRTPRDSVARRVPLARQLLAHRGPSAHTGGAGQHDPACPPLSLGAPALGCPCQAVSG